MRQEIGTHAGQCCEELSEEEGMGSLSRLPDRARAVPEPAEEKGKKEKKGNNHFLKA